MSQILTQEKQDTFGENEWAKRMNKCYLEQERARKRKTNHRRSVKEDHIHRESEFNLQEFNCLQA